MVDKSGDSQTEIVGILNVTPDSFYDGGRYVDEESALERVRAMEEAGADVVDVGGESTRPGANPVPVQEEKNRVLPVLRKIVESTTLDVSVDTTKPAIAREALEVGVDFLNVVTGFEKPEMLEVVSDYSCSVIIMHMQGTPRTMQENPVYDDVVEDVRRYLTERANTVMQKGVPEDSIVIDPGVGFGKTLEHNRKLLNHIDVLKDTGLSVMVGHSRKSFLEGVLGRNVENRKVGTLAVSSRLMDQNVDMLRVHDVRDHVELRRVGNWLDNTKGGTIH